MKRLLFGVVVLLAIGSVTTFANDDKKVPSTLVSAISRAADNLLARQGTYLDGDTRGGNMVCAWEWIPGSGYANANTQSTSSRGLLAAYRVTDKASHLKGALCAAKELVLRLDAITKRPYSEDVIFLTEISETSGNRAYAKKAADYHRRIRRDFATGASLADHYIDARKSLAGWDLSSQIQAALAVDQEDYAQAIVERLIQRRGDWEFAPYGGWDYTSLSRSALISALQDFEGKTVKKYRDEIRQATLAAQGADGSWGDPDNQGTAFALYGLAAAPKSAAVRTATSAGIRYLLATQSASGAFIDVYGENTEVSGEVLSALCLYVRGHEDGERNDR